MEYFDKEPFDKGPFEVVTIYDTSLFATTVGILTDTFTLPEEDWG